MRGASMWIAPPAMSASLVGVDSAANAPRSSARVSRSVGLCRHAARRSMRCCARSELTSISTRSQSTSARLVPGGSCVPSTSTVFVGGMRASLPAPAPATPAGVMTVVCCTTPGRLPPATVRSTLHTSYASCSTIASQCRRDSAPLSRSTRPSAIIQPMDDIWWVAAISHASAASDSCGPASPSSARTPCCRASEGRSADPITAHAASMAPAPTSVLLFVCKLRSAQHCSMTEHAACRPRKDTPPTPHARPTRSDAEPVERVTATPLSFISDTSCQSTDAASSFPAPVPEPSSLVSGPNPPSRTIAYRSVALAAAKCRSPVAACSRSVGVAPDSRILTSCVTTASASVATPTSSAANFASSHVYAVISMDDTCELSVRMRMSTGLMAGPSIAHISGRHPASTSAAWVETDRARIAPLACSRASLEHCVRSITM
mmetsp:Transcript_36521/g.91043  ORF Transcript_36521/g.91043 Transcript_36521/m.91043 type:complete len:433 (+) Transcript_36521:5020-6318(+)